MPAGQRVNQKGKLYSENASMILYLMLNICYLSHQYLHAHQSRMPTPHPLTVLEAVLRWRSYEALDGTPVR
jgi:hypothetical protein